MATMTRRERRHHETRKEILDAARAIVAQRGAKHLSMRELARRTDFTPAALYRYFEGGKEEILLELAREVFDKVAAHLAKVPPDLPPDERLIELGVAYLDFARRHPGELALLFDSLSALDIDTEKGVFTPTRLFQILDEVLRDGVAEGTLRGDDEDIMVMWHGAWSLVHGMASIEAMQEHHHEDMFRGRGRDVLRAYVNGLKTDWAAGGR